MQLVMDNTSLESREVDLFNHRATRSSMDRSNYRLSSPRTYYRHSIYLLIHQLFELLELVTSALMITKNKAIIPLVPLYVLS